MKSNRLGRSVPSVQQLEAMRPRDADRLHRLVENLLQVRVARRAVVPGNDAPFDYLCAAFFEADRGDDAGAAATHDVAPRRDLIVWANRGGGKTLLGAVATVLDMVFKPGIEIRILGGSLKQSSKMHEYLRQMFEREPLLRRMVAASSERELVLFNRSRVRLLAQSSRSVRGEHVHKLRCDELDEFHDPIWKAAQLVTQSGMCGSVAVRGTVEAISTMHRRFGPMSRLLDHAGAGAGTGARVLKWSALDVMARCPARRPCEGCPLWDDCQGLAKEAAGHVPVDEMIARRHRTDDETWAAEMMCQRPRSDAAVFPAFEATQGGPHVAVVAAERNEAATATATVAIPATVMTSATAAPPATAAGGTADDRASREGSLLIGGMDFGIRDPFVMLWARLIPPVAGAMGSGNGVHRGPPVHRGNEAVHRRDWMLEVFDELIETGLTMEQAVIRMESRGWSRPAWIAADPAGHQLNRQTGISDIGHLRRRGYRIITRPARIDAGIHAIRRRLDRGLIRIDPRCIRLIKDLSQYHFDPDNPQNENPVKDGSDHACDALRYMVMALETGDERVQTRMW